MMYNKNTHPNTRENPRNNEVYGKLVLWLTFGPLATVIAVGTLMALIKPEFMGF